MTLAPNDLVLLGRLLAYRCLTASQLARLTERSPKVVRRAMALRLVPEGLVLPLDRSPTEEAAYTLGPAGLAFVAEQEGFGSAGLPCPASPPGPRRGLFWAHTALVNEIRIAFDLAAARDDSPIVIDRTVPEWELLPGAAAQKAHHERYVLSERLVTSDGSVHVHRPDCLFLMRARGAPPDQLVAAFVEADRNTEPMAVIRRKLAAFWLFWGRRLHAERFGAAAMRVLFVLDDVRDRTRLRSVQAEVARFCDAQPNHAAAAAFRGIFRFARKADLDERSALAEPIWSDAFDTPRLFYRPAAAATTTGGALVEPSA